MRKRAKPFVYIACVCACDGEPVVARANIFYNSAYGVFFGILFFFSLFLSPMYCGVCVNVVLFTSKSIDT